MAKPSPKKAKASLTAGAGPDDAPEASGPARAPGADDLPDAAAVAALMAPVEAFALAPAHARVRGFLQRLAKRPPQVLLLEGGTPELRLAAAHYWSLLLNCPAAQPAGKTARAAPESAAPAPAAPPSLPLLPFAPAIPEASAPAPAAPEAATPPSADPARSAPESPLPGETRTPAESGGVSNSLSPCFSCPECIRMVTHLHRDCFFLDGSAGSIKIDDVRALRGVLGEPPREAARRVVVFREAQSLMEAAANALLKSFEEPRPATSFVMLAPQRERLLPTLVSRSLVLTLPWPGGHAPQEDENLAPWVAALCLFAESGRGWFERSGSKGSVDAPLAHALINACRRALAARFTDLCGGNAPAEGLESLFARLPLERLRMLDEVLAECQDSLIYTVNPTLVLEWLATRLYLLVPRKR